MSSRRLTPLLAGLVVSLGLAALVWFVTPSTPDQTRRSANTAAIQGDRAPAAAAQAGVQMPPAARRGALEPNLLQAARRGRLMPGSSHNDAPTPGMLGDQATSPQASREPREERMRGAGTFDGDLRNITTSGVSRRRSRPEREEPVARPVPLPGTSTPVETGGGISPTGVPSLPAGLKFTPVAGATSADTVFSFEVQGATSNTGGGLGQAATATITVTAPLEASTDAVGPRDR